MFSNSVTEYWSEYDSKTEQLHEQNNEKVTSICTSPRQLEDEVIVRVKDGTPELANSYPTKHVPLTISRVGVNS